MIDFKKFYTAEFWSKKEISYQYVHFTNALFITFVAMMLYTNFASSKLFIIPALISGFLTGCLVELKQWIGGNHKVEDMVRDLFFWALGNIIGLYFFFK